MIRKKVNRDRINEFKRQDGRSRSRLEPSRMVREFSFIFGMQGLGYGIDCMNLGKKIKQRWWFGTYYINADEVNYLKTATATLGYNYPKKRWYIQTSFPVKNR